MEIFTAHQQRRHIALEYRPSASALLFWLWRSPPAGFGAPPFPKNLSLYLLCLQQNTPLITSVCIQPGITFKSGGNIDLASFFKSGVLP
jgi:hypothetical protein